MEGTSSVELDDVELSGGGTTLATHNDRPRSEVDVASTSHPTSTTVVHQQEQQSQQQHSSPADDGGNSGGPVSSSQQQQGRGSSGADDADDDDDVVMGVPIAQPPPPTLQNHRAGFGHGGGGAPTVFSAAHGGMEHYYSGEGGDLDVMYSTDVSGGGVAAGAGGGQHNYIVGTGPDGSTAILAIDNQTGQAQVAVVPLGAGSGMRNPDLMAAGLTLPVDEKLSLLWRMARTIRIYALADLLLVIFACFVWIWFAILSPFPVIGFIGAMWFFPIPTIIFAFYFPLAIIGRVYITYSATVDAESDSMKGIHIFLGIVGVLLEVYCMRLVIIFGRALVNTHPADRRDLRKDRANIDRRMLWW